MAEVFLRGCAFDESDQEMLQVANERKEQMIAQVRNFNDDWNIDYFESVFRGVTLKHLLDHIFNF